MVKHEGIKLLSENRNTIEWSNTWLSCADCETDRCLFIGDSVTREIRKKIESFLYKWLKVDLFAASFAITSDLFWNYLSCFLTGGYQYKVIVINYGFHHGFAMRCEANEINTASFKEKYQELIEICKQLCDEVIVMTGTSFVLEDRIEVIDTELEQEILARNAIVTQVAADLKCRVFDLHNLMRTRGKEFKYIDFVHFEQKTYSFIAYEMVFGLALIDEKERNVVQKETYELLGDEKESKIIIYGAGLIANHLYFLLKYFCPNIEIAAWAVTDNSGIKNEIYGIPLVNIRDTDNNISLVIAASEKNKLEMKNTAESLGFRKIKYFTAIKWKNLLADE